MFKKRIIPIVLIKENIVVQSIKFNKYLPIGKPEAVIENLDRWGADEIIVLMILPGIDMIRVASSRILRKQHAFEPDQNHLHHLLMKMFNEKISYFIIIGIILLTCIISKFIKYDVVNILSITTVILIYLFFVQKIKLK